MALLLGGDGVSEFSLSFGITPKLKEFWEKQKKPSKYQYKETEQFLKASVWNFNVKHIFIYMNNEWYD